MKTQEQFKFNKFPIFHSLFYEMDCGDYGSWGSYKLNGKLKQNYEIGIYNEKTNTLTKYEVLEQKNNKMVLEDDETCRKKILEYKENNNEIYYILNSNDKIDFEDVFITIKPLNLKEFLYYVEPVYNNFLKKYRKELYKMDIEIFYSNDEYQYFLMFNIEKYDEIEEKINILYKNYLKQNKKIA